MSKFYFKSKVCTSIEQSRKLLELGIVPETADCAHFYEKEENGDGYFWDTVILEGDWESYWEVTETEIPAWSLGRLIEFIFSIGNVVLFYPDKNSIDAIIEQIEYMVKDNYFKKEYLKWGKN